MAQDLRDLLKQETQVSHVKMSEGHKARFLEKLDQELPVEKTNKPFKIWRVAASVVILLGLSYAALQFGNEPAVEVESQENSSELRTLGDLSPELKKVEDFYLASINLELSKVKLTPENKELFEGYLNKLEELNLEYKNLNKELTENGPNPLTVDAAINNLKLRLNLMMRLQEQMKALETNDDASSQF